MSKSKVSSEAIRIAVNKQREAKRIKTLHAIAAATKKSETTK